MIYYTVLAFLFYLSNIFLNALIMSLAHERVPVDIKPLPDVLFDVLPYWNTSVHLVEYYTICLNLLFFILLVLHQSRLRIALRYFLISGIVYFIRALCIGLTQLPVANNRFMCKPKINSYVSYYEFIKIIIKRSFSFEIYFNLWDEKRFCEGDTYSGYTANIVIGNNRFFVVLFPFVQLTQKI